MKKQLHNFFIPQTSAELFKAQPMSLGKGWPFHVGATDEEILDNVDFYDLLGTSSVMMSKSEKVAYYRQMFGV